MPMNRIPKCIYKLCKFALTFLSFFSSLSVCGQAANNTVSIYNAKGDTMYSDKSNAVAVVSDSSIRKQILITVNQGRIFSPDKQIYLVDSLKNGRLVVSAFKVDKGKKMLLIKKSYIVVTSPEKIVYDGYGIEHGFNLLGHYKGNVPVSMFKKIDRISLSPGLELVSAVVYITVDKEFAEPNYTIISSAKFPDHLLKAWAKIKAGNIVIFDEVKVKDRQGNIITLPNNFRFNVIAD